MCTGIVRQSLVRSTHPQPGPLAFCRSRRRSIVITSGQGGSERNTPVMPFRSDILEGTGIGVTIVLGPTSTGAVQLPSGDARNTAGGNGGWNVTGGGPTGGHSGGTPAAQRAGGGSAGRALTGGNPARESRRRNTGTGTDGENGGGENGRGKCLPSSCTLG